jgi:hypothetical protein
MNLLDFKKTQVENAIKVLSLCEHLHTRRWDIGNGKLERRCAKCGGLQPMHKNEPL